MRGRYRFLLELPLGSTALKALLEDAHARLQDHFGKVTRKGGRAHRVRKRRTAPLDTEADAV
ncbi:MAG TPA: hypothetical protein VHC91_10635 [Trinickia sp.]|uniref:hypothetical protein n=1 Tax=Trinickia sp. TaxID=2571163 RepID=UPI002C5E7113|nr:hypothetical protein [Trinickia sp.]HVW50834.1 hypothetical protein [Trinickia sp.]